jgi:WD40 repeat protein
VSGNGKYLIRADTLGTLSLVDLGSGKIQESPEISKGVTTAIFNPDDHLVAIGTTTGDISLFNVPQFERLAILSGHTGQISRLAFSPDGRLLASGSDDSSVRVWSVLERQLLNTVRSDSPVVGLAFSPDGSRLVVITQKGTVYGFETATGRILSRDSSAGEPLTVDFFLCLGENPGECRGGNSVWAPCYTDPVNWAKTNHPAQCVNVKAKVLSSVSGNRCGYTTFQISCSSQ